jgi:hypothetical protein
MMIIGGYIQMFFKIKVKDVDYHAFEYYLSKRLDFNDEGELYLKPDKIVETPPIFDKLVLQGNYHLLPSLTSH